LFSFGVVIFVVKFVAEFIVISWRVFKSCVAKFLFCHPSSGLRTKKISACAQGGLVAKSVKRFPVNLRIRVRFQLNSTHPCHPPSTFSIADSSAKQNSDEKFLLSLSSVSMDDICNQFKFLVG